MTHQVQTVESPGDAFHDAEHRDRRVCPELPVHYPKLVVERFISRPLRDMGKNEKQKDCENRKKEKSPEGRINGLSLAAHASQKRGKGGGWEKKTVDTPVPSFAGSGCSF